MLKKMTVEEKAALVSGHNGMYTNAIPSVDLPALHMSDGPHGLRTQDSSADNGFSSSLPSTAFPTSATTASSWNPENLKKIGGAIAEECRHYGVDVILGPGVNIKRNPLCGRNFEYFSEDPYLAAEMGIAFTNGVQERGVGVSVKHFAANNNENYRNMGNSVADERALREIYLRAFERIVKECDPASLMCAYNQINGEYCSENKWLLTDVLRDEWKYEGIVMTDWGAVNDRVKGVLAGLDLEMPGDSVCRDWIISAVKEGRLSGDALDVIAERVLRFVTKWHKAETTPCDFKAHHKLASEIAEDCAVLLKNDGVLPLVKEEKYLVVGNLFEKMRYQGSGSSMINPTEITSPKASFEDRGISFEYVMGYSENKTAPDRRLIHEAAAAAKNYETVIVFAGLTDLTESEGGDRENMCLPANQLALIDALVGTGKKVVVVLFGGSPVELPFAEKVSAILDMYLPGQGGGNATTRLLFGEANPSGKLAETWPITYADVPFGNDFAKHVNELYKESIFVGYRYYNTVGKAVRYPFGFGLSYTNFSYSDLKAEENGDEIKVTCTVTNTGKRAGAEVVQLYTAIPGSAGGFFAKRELRSFDKVYLAAGESKTATLSFNKSDLKYFDLTEKKWRLASGEYGILVGASVEDIRLQSTLMIEGDTPKFEENAYTRREIDAVEDAVFETLLGFGLPEEPADVPVTIQTRLDRFVKTYNGRRIFKMFLAPCGQMRAAAKQMPDGTEKDNLLKSAKFLERIMYSNSLRSLCMCMGPGGMITYNSILGFVEIANGNLFEGMALMGQPCEMSKLPADNDYKLPADND